MLYVVATPIGNLEDITLRALRILREADFIACEDTRVTKKLLSHFKINTLAISYHQHSRLTKIDWIIQQLKSGKNVALATDAGTPGISDPGNILISECAKNKIKIVPIPGPSALTALASVSGINMQKFIFMAFPPHKKGREKFFKEITAAKYPVIYYESPHRLVKNLELLASFKKNASIIVGRELTKMFEEIIRGTVPEVLNYFQNKDKIKGEFAVIIY
ncbi:16S rRNA (cytidine(1402)-2'-O)-methyltransferase [Patescibacteria group bacterium]|nr:16S rRNA (cytidine(1402)-2'-O)-methyltransferase [Patescibacteria group bacterium]